MKKKKITPEEISLLVSVLENSTDVVWEYYFSSYFKKIPKSECLCFIVAQLEA